MRLADLKEQLSTMSKDEIVNSEFVEDRRVGAQKLIKQRLKQIEQFERLREAFEEKVQFDNQYIKHNNRSIVGIDEVGRGPIAGPVVTCAVVISPHESLIEVRDSKQLSTNKLLELNELIKEHATSYAYGVVSNDLIDEMNIYEASRYAMKIALEKVDTTVDIALIDAMTLEHPIEQYSITKGDDKSFVIGCASILAKVHRDELMKEYDEKYPGYGFSQHVGYPTKYHIEQVNALGISPIHRKSFQPIKGMIEG